MTPLLLVLVLLFSALASWMLVKGMLDPRRRVRLYSVAAVGLILLVPTLAHAGSPNTVVTGGDPGDWKNWLFTTVIAPVLVQGWRWLSAHVGVKKAAEKLGVDELWDKIGDDAIDFAEELAHRAIKRGSDRLTGEAKENKAVAAVLELAKKHGLKIPPAWKSKAEQWARDLIARRLGARRGTAARSA